VPGHLGDGLKKKMVQVLGKRFSKTVIDALPSKRDGTYSSGGPGHTSTQRIGTLLYLRMQRLYPAKESHTGFHLGQH